MIQFANPFYLLGLLLIPLYLYYELKVKNKRKLSLTFSRLDLLKRLQFHNRLWQYLYPAIRSLIFLFLIIAISRPQWGVGFRDYQNKGVDIVIALDVSGSMLALDFAPENRLEAAKKVARRFIKDRPNDRFGLVAFSEYALSQCPITLDHDTVLEQLSKVNVNKDASATAIGLGLAKAVARLKDSTAKSKVIILITDGVNNTGEIDPINAANMAKQLGIKVYTIGVGSNGLVDFPFDDPTFGTTYRKVMIEMDIDTLDKIAALTGTNQAALASNTGQLEEIMQMINQMEKTQQNIHLTYAWKDRFMLFLWLAFGLMCLEFVFRSYIQPIIPE